MSGEVETRARELGWVPQEEFRGDTAKWVDADTFVRRGEEMLPLLRKHNKDLEGQVTRLNGELTTMKQLFEETQASVKELGKFHTEETARQVEAARKELRAQLIEARRSGDVETEVAVQEQLDDIRDAQKGSTSAPPPPPAAPPPSAPKADPIWEEWKSTNAPWFGKDNRKSALLVASAEELRRNGEKSSGVEFFNKALADLEEYLGTPSSSSRQKVEGSGGGGGGGSGGGSKSTYSSLPGDAKSACDGMEKKFVGAGKAFKTQAEWRAHYAQQYYASGE